ncbi:MAG: preprotein translocase subunit SecA [Gammaproteobacteria bacterium]|nr:preprotein translocase subunit SecA [Gammaproteobacteria bacterium]
MVMQVFSKIFGSKNERELKRMGQIVSQISELEDSMAQLSDEEIRNHRELFQNRLAAGETLDDLLPEAFALTREAAKRNIRLRIYDVQMVGGITLHEGRIAEMRTGEGKTLVATLPLYLNGLMAEGVQLITVNDYLAKRDAAWMGPVYAALGMTVGVIHAGQTGEEKKHAYACDVTYGTNNEFGFDYLRDNMAFNPAEKVQRRLLYAIVDEVDSILIDEARTPLIISGGIEDNSDLYRVINTLIPSLTRQEKTPEDVLNKVEPPGDYFVDEKQKDVELTESGHQLVEKLLIKKGLVDKDGSLYGTANLNLLHHVHAALKAHLLFHRDVEYMMQDNEIIIVDEHTGRTMPGRRWSGGIHQAIEAKEGVPISQESQTLASTTFQNYFRLYEKLSGMTGTADTEAFEFRQIYGLDVVVIPTNVPMIRNDLDDLIYMTKEEKYEAIAVEIRRLKAKGVPMLVGTASIESSEVLSALLDKAKIKHSTLNAKFHEKEAEIIAQAGRSGTVTIATNMAGRGTDIVLGGNWEAEIAELKDPQPEQIEAIRKDWQKRHDEVIKAGGLYILGTERHESRRIDNQLRGRSGRMGDPGESRFYLSLEDDLMRIFASDRVKRLMQTLGMEKGEAIEHRMVTNAIEKAQRKVEGRNFDIRKQLLEYDDVANDQRQMIYAQRNDLMEGDDVTETIDALFDDVISQVIDGFIPPQSLEEQWDIAGLEQSCQTEFNARLTIKKWLDDDDELYEDSLREKIIHEIKQEYAAKGNLLGPDIKVFEKQIMLQILDNLWKEHLAAMDYLRQGIHLRAYAQKQPKQEYKREAFELFEELLNAVKFEVVRFLAKVQFRQEENVQDMEQKRRQAEARNKMQFQKESASSIGSEPEEVVATPFVRRERKVGRNEPCPCGSGKKYKLCHGKL